MNLNLEQFSISCPHCTGNVGTFPDYHPLTVDEVLEMLQLATEIGPKGSDLSVIQERLCQGITGMTCPRPADGLAMKRRAYLNKEYVDFIHDILDRGVVPNRNMAEKLHHIMTEWKP